MKFNQPKFYKTRDLYEAAAILSLGFKFEGLENVNRSKAYFFLFKDNGKIEKLSFSYFNGTLKVNARKFVDSIRFLKSKVHTGGS